MKRVIKHMDFVQAVLKAMAFVKDNVDIDVKVLIPETLQHSNGLFEITIEYEERDIIEMPYTENILVEHLLCKNLVKKVLEEQVDTRNCDKTLVFEVWRRQGLKINITPEQLDNIFNSESIRRSRADIQNKNGLFLPTTYAVAKRRRLNEDLLRAYYGTNKGD